MNMAGGGKKKTLDVDALNLARQHTPNFRLKKNSILEREQFHIFLLPKRIKKFIELFFYLSVIITITTYNLHQYTYYSKFKKYKTRTERKLSCVVC